MHGQKGTATHPPHRHITTTTMNVIFKLNSDIIAATVSEWVITDGTPIVSLSHSEYEMITLNGDQWEVDGAAIAILEMTPDIRKYL